MTSEIPFSPHNSLHEASYIKAIQWLQQHLKSNESLLYVILSLGGGASNSLLDFAAWAVQYDRLKPWPDPFFPSQSTSLSSRSPATDPFSFPFVAWAKEYQRATSHLKENRSTDGPPIDNSDDELYDHVDQWLTYWREEDPDFQSLLVGFGLFPLGGLVHFILWAFEKNILQDIPQEKDLKKPKGSKK